MTTCTICQRTPIRPSAALKTICEECATTLGVRALPPARRPALPCRRCSGTVFVRTMPRELSVLTGKYVDRNQAVHAPMAATYEIDVEFASLSKTRLVLRELDPKEGRGLFEIYICRGCGYVEWYCAEPAEIPIGEQYMTEIVDYTAQAPYR